MNETCHTSTDAGSVNESNESNECNECSKSNEPHSSSDSGCRYIKRVKRLSYINAFLNGAFWTLTGIQMTNPVYLTLYAQELGGTNLHFSIIPMLWSLSSLPIFWVSYMVERSRSTKAACVWSMLVMASLAAPLGWVGSALAWSGKTGIWAVFGVLLVGNFISNYYVISLLIWLPSLVPAKWLGRFHGTRLLYYTAGVMISQVAAGQLLELFPGELGFNLLFLLAGLVGLITILLLLPLPCASTPPLRNGDFSKALSTLLHDLNFRNLILLLLTINFAWALSGVFPTVFMRKELQLPYDRIGMLTALASLGGLFANLVWGQMVDRLGAKPVTTVSLFGMMVASLLWAGNSRARTALLPLAHLAGGVSTSAISVSILPLLYRTVCERHRSLALAFWFLTCASVGLVSPLVGGQIVSLAGNWHAQVLSHEVGAFHVLFVCQFVAFLLALPFVSKVKEPGGRRTREVPKLLLRQTGKLFTAYLPALWQPSPRR